MIHYFNRRLYPKFVRPILNFILRIYSLYIFTNSKNTLLSRELIESKFSVDIYDAKYLFEFANSSLNPQKNFFFKNATNWNYAQQKSLFYQTIKSNLQEKRPKIMSQVPGTKHSNKKKKKKCPTVTAGTYIPHGNTSVTNITRNNIFISS